MLWVSPSLQGEKATYIEKTLDTLGGGEFGFNHKGPRYVVFTGEGALLEGLNGGVAQMGVVAEASLVLSVALLTTGSEGGRNRRKARDDLGTVGSRSWVEERILGLGADCQTTKGLGKVIARGDVGVGLAAIEGSLRSRRSNASGRGSEGRASSLGGRRGRDESGTHLGDEGFDYENPKLA